MLKLYTFSHPDFNGMVIISVIAYDEDQARFLASDYDNEFSFDPSTFILKSVKNLNKGVVVYEYE